MPFFLEDTKDDDQITRPLRASLLAILTIKLVRGPPISIGSHQKSPIVFNNKWSQAIFFFTSSIGTVSPGSHCFGYGFIDSGSGSSILGRIRIRIRNWPIRIQDFAYQKLKKKLPLEKHLIFFRSTIAIYLSLGLHKGCPSYGEASAIEREQPALKIKFIIFSNFFLRPFLPFWIRIQNPNPDLDPMTWLNPDPKPYCFPSVYIWCRGLACLSRRRDQRKWACSQGPARAPGQTRVAPPV